MQSQEFDQPPEQPKQRKVSYREILRASVADAKRVVGNLNTHADSNRRAKVDAALLGGVCIALLIAFLNLQHLDAFLIAAIAAFALAIPFLVMGLLAPTGVNSDVPGWRLVAALVIGAWVVEGLGQLAVAIGVGAILGHFSNLALTLYVAAIVFIVVIVPMLCFIGLFIYALTQVKNVPDSAKKP